MSKSKKNVVDPQEIITSYGADTARLFMMSDSPPERDLQWTESGIDGAWRYVSRLNNLVQKRKDTLVDGAMDASDNTLALRRQTHKTIAAVTDHYENLHYNKAVAGLRQFSNFIESYKPATPSDFAALKEAVEALIIMFHPVVPHLGEELWKDLGHADQMICDAPWPTADESLLEEDTITIAIQVNGKLRDTIDLPANTDKDTTEKAALESPVLVKMMEGKEPKRVIVVPNKIVNIVL